jgi:hypothetical protein
MDVYLTTSEAIRAVLGVSEDSQELPDSVFTDMELETEIELQMETWLLEVANTSVVNVLSTGSARARTAIPLCAKYLGALILLPSLLTATASKLSDGQDEFQRQDRDIDNLRRDLQAMLGKYQGIILEALEATASALPFQVIGRAIPNYDPITGA